MTLQPSPRTKHLLAFVAVLAVIASMTFVLTRDGAPIFGDAGGPEMALVIVDQPDACQNQVCAFDRGSSFTLGVEVTTAPSNGYISLNTYVLHGPDLTYEPRPASTDEILWPDCETSIALRGTPNVLLPPPGVWDQAVSHGCATGVVATPPSDFVGMVVEFDLICSQEPSRTDVIQLPFDEFPFESPAGTNGAVFIEPSAANIIPKLTGLTIFCGEPPTPTPTPSVTPGGPSLTPTPTTTPTPTSTPTVTETPIQPTATATLPSALPCGDVNGDRLVNSQDALWVLWYVTNTIPFLQFPSDVDGDGFTGPMDALFILWIELNLYICR